jgi:tRNA threonylcarbamoyladenosine biosynthesis protein TsaB
MSWLLHIETATPMCGVALANNGKIVSQRISKEGLHHAENLHVFIEDCLSEAKIKPNDISAISVSNGPGSYTGLRIGMSAAKGLAYALQIPLISISTLSILCENAKVKYDLNETSLLCPMFDARRMEIYTGLYTSDLTIIRAPEALVVDEDWVKSFSEMPSIYFFGDGMDKCRNLLSNLPNVVFLENVFPFPEAALPLALKAFETNHFEDVAYAEPAYLKPYFFAKKKE